ncbi:MAG: 13E12 repeat family protein [Acidimicrobiia bacterium]|nr:13E12 repeat family protein [Acidimicrobiia bacterium]
MFDTLTRDPSLEAWLDEADRRDSDVALAVAEADGSMETAPVPPDLADIEPGIVLAAALSAIDIDGLSAHDRVIVLAAHQRMASHYQAQVYASMASVADAVSEQLHDDGETDFELVEDACSSEISAALRLTRRAADSELSIARDFKTRLPAVWQAFVSGRIDRRRANLILHRTEHLDADRAREVARQALERASELTAGQLASLLRKLSVEADPADAEKRYENAVEERRVVLDSSVDGTAHLYLMDLPPDRAVRIRDHLDATARSLRTDGESRTMDQLRADVVLDMLDPIQPSSRRKSRRGALVLTVDLATLAGLTETSGDLNGYGPVVADIARQVAEASPLDEWRFVITDDQRRSLQAGLTRRRPVAAARRMVEAMYPRCVFPGCRVPASRCDLDHTTPWGQSHRTPVDGLAPLCRRHHRLRHRAAWRYRPTDDGDHEWISPLGHRYADRARSP